MRWDGGWVTLPKPYRSMFEVVREFTDDYVNETYNEFDDIDEQVYHYYREKGYRQLYGG